MKRSIQVNRSEFTRHVRPDQRADEAVGVTASVLILIPISDDGTCVRHVVETPGMWGMQGATEKYLNEVFAEECGLLETMLAALGVEVRTDEDNDVALAHAAWDMMNEGDRFE